MRTTRPGVAGLSCGFFAVSLLASQVARAASLDYSAPESCPERQGVIEDIERLIGSPLSSVAGVDFVLRVAERGNGRYRATVRTVPKVETEESRARELDGDTCAQATDAAIVAIALAVRGAESEDAETNPETASEPTPAPTRAAPRTPGKALRKKSAPMDGPAPLELGMGVVGLADLGALPAVAPGGGVELFAGFRSARFIAFGAGFASQEKRLSDGSGGRFGLVLGGLVACLVRRLDGFRFAGCGGFEAGSLSAEGFGLIRPTRESVTWLAPKLEARPEINLVGDLRAMLGVGATFPLTRHNFVLNGVRPVHRPAGLTGRLMAGLSFSF